MNLVIKTLRLLRNILGRIEGKLSPRRDYKISSENSNVAAKASSFDGTKKLKVALCFSGQIRNLDKGFEYINKNVILPNQDCEIDVFVHCWFDHQDIGKEYFAANGTLVKSPVSEASLANIYKYYNPQKMLAEKQIRFEDKQYYANKPDAIIPWYSLSKNYSIKRSFGLKAEHEKQHNFTYDLVMSLRFDLGLEAKVEFKNFNPDLVTQSENGCVNGEGVDVTHAIIGGKLADKYASFFDYMDQYYKEGIRFCDEPMMHRHLDFHKIPFIRSKELNNYTLLR